MLDFIKLFNNNYNHISNLLMFNFFKTGNSVYDAIISTTMISLIGFLTNYIYENGLTKVLNYSDIDDMKSLFYKKNTIILEGRRSAITCSYTITCNISATYTDRLKAILNYIISNIDKNDTIYII